MGTEGSHATAAMITAEERVAEGKAEVMAEVATPTGGGRWRARRRCRWRGRRWGWPAGWTYGKDGRDGRIWQRGALLMEVVAFCARRGV